MKIIFKVFFEEISSIKKDDDYPAFDKMFASLLDASFTLLFYQGMEDPEQPGKTITLEEFHAVYKVFDMFKDTEIFKQWTLEAGILLMSNTSDAKSESFEKDVSSATIAGSAAPQSNKTGGAFDAVWALSSALTKLQITDSPD